VSESPEAVRLKRAVTQTVTAAWEEGCPVAGGDADDTATVALRRWRSFDRRGPAKRATFEDRVEDLAKGLRDRFEADPAMVGPLMEDYRHLASCLAPVLRGGDG
jgi:hypothetical protein